jgi:hypothetical protein
MSQIVIDEFFAGYGTGRYGNVVPLEASCQGCSSLQGWYTLELPNKPLKRLCRTCIKKQTG